MGSAHAAPRRRLDSRHDDDPSGSDRALAVLEYTGWVPFAFLIGFVGILAAASIAWIASPLWGRNAEAVARNVGTVPTQAPAAATLSDIVSPTRIVIPQLSVTAPIVPVGTTADGALAIPQNPQHVGWWRYGAKPGQARGTAILAGHINYAGVTGTMAKIGKLNPGDEIDIFGKHDAQSRHKVRFSVTGVRTYHKTSLPYKSIFSQQSISRIAIVTCGGAFDSSTGHYQDNIVVFAVPRAG